MSLSSPSKQARDLIDLPNISIVLAEDLTRVGLDTPDRLKEIGAGAAWRRLRESRLHHEARVLFALEGAIQGIAWRSLPAARRHELLQEVEF